MSRKPRNNTETSDDYGWMKMLGGAAAGIGTVALLPIFGPIGSVSAFGLIVGGSAGAGAGFYMAEQEKEDNDRSLRNIDAFHKRNAREGAQVRMETADSADSLEAYYKMLECVYAAGAYALAAGGKGDENACDQAREFIDSMLVVWADDSFTDRLGLLFDAPPTKHELKRMLEVCAERADVDQEGFYQALELSQSLLCRNGFVETGLDIIAFLELTEKKPDEEVEETPDVKDAEACPA